MKLSILIPSDFTCTTGFTLALATLTSDISAMGQEFGIANEQSSLLCQSRHRLLKWAREEKSEYILFLDSDMVFPIYTYRQLLQADKDIICCNYTTRKAPLRPVLHKDNRYVDSRYLCGIEEVDNVALGVCLMRASVLKEIEPPYYNFEWMGDNREDPYKGEDYFFTEKIKAAGYKIYCDHDLSKVILHEGSMMYGWRNMPENPTLIKEPI